MLTTTLMATGLDALSAVILVLAAVAYFVGRHFVRKYMDQRWQKRHAAGKDSKDWDVDPAVLRDMRDNAGMMYKSPGLSGHRPNDDHLR